MITLDRTSSISVQEQLVEQVRYLIASGHYNVDDYMPSTRVLAEQVGVSFHTVRKAYQQLEEEGLLEARVGSGFRVRERVPLGKSERIERGASVVQEALHRLIGLGLQEAEIEYLFEEQLAAVTSGQHDLKVLFASPSRELAALCAEQIGHVVQRTVEACSIDALPHHHDADFVLTAFSDLHHVMEHLPRVDALGVATHLNADSLEQTARLLPQQTLGLVTRYADTIPVLMTTLRRESGFSGQTLATSIEEGTHDLTQFIRQTDLLLYTPPCRRRLLSLLDNVRHTVVTPIISRDFLDRILQALPA